MLERTVVMSFKDESGKKLNLSVKHVKEDVQDSDISSLMDNIITNKLIKTEAGDLKEKVEAQVVTREATKVTM
ncbi:hypothetical protein JCM1393_07230 [Clostridium carnis]